MAHKRLLLVLVILMFRPGMVSAQCSNPCRPTALGRLADNAVVNFNYDTSMQGQDLTDFRSAIAVWNVELSSYGSSAVLQDGSFGWLVELDVNLPSGTWGETDYTYNIIRINPLVKNWDGFLYKVALHELGHAILLNDVYTSGCSVSDTVMFGNQGPETAIGALEPGDDCTMEHVYSRRDESPIVLRLDGKEPRFTGPSVWFDLANCGSPQLLGWTQEGIAEGFLAMDRDGDGAITSGAEMFGNFTPLPDHNGYLAGNGFQVLAEMDEPSNGGNNDGWITRTDAVFGRLRLWVDLNHNGLTDPGELKTLEDVGVIAIATQPRESHKRDRYGNELRYVAPFMMRTPTGDLLERMAVDVFFVRQ